MLFAWLAVCAPVARAAEPPIAGTLDLARATGPARGIDERLSGQVGRGQAGSSVAFVGDVNGDGRQDYAVGAPRSINGAGEVVIVYGPPRGGEVQLGSRLGDRGLRVWGPHPEARLGSSVAAAGDVDGDGFDDVLAGAPGARFADRGTTGAAYVIRGGARPPSGRIRLRSSAAGAGVVRGAAEGDNAGVSVASIRDLDGDGRRELAVGAPNAAGLGRGNAGAAYVIYSTGLASGVDLAAIDRFGHRIDGVVAGDETGVSVSEVGDMSGDGLAELIVGAPSVNAMAGAAYVVWGRRPGTGSVDLAALGGQGFTLAGQGGERAGGAVAGLDDATGDGIPDIAVGASSASPMARTGAGTAYIAAGRADPTRSALAGSVLQVWGADPREALGAALSPAGDADGDGSADLLIGSTGDRALARVRAGSATLLYTGRASRPGIVDGALLDDGGVRFAGREAYERSGRGVAGGTDVDGDGRPDVLIGGSTARRGTGGASLVLTPPAPEQPTAPELTGGLKAGAVKVIIDDSPSMGRFDPGGVLRQQALELVLTNPANGNRVFGAVEFGRRAHQVFAPLRVSQSALQGERLEVLRGLLRERIANDSGQTDFGIGLAAATQLKPPAQAHIFFTDGGQLGAVTTFGKVPTHVIGLGLGSGRTRDRLSRIAKDSGGDLYSVGNAGELQSALAAIDARLRGETALATTVAAAPGVEPVRSSAQNEGAAEVTGGAPRIVLEGDAQPTASRPARKLRLAVTWNRRDSRFQLRTLELRQSGGRRVKVTPKRLRLALRGRAQHVGGLRLEGRAGKTFLTLDVTGLQRVRAGRRAAASALFIYSTSRLRRTRGSRLTVVRSRWTYQSRPT